MTAQEETQLDHLYQQEGIKISTLSDENYELRQRCAELEAEIAIVTAERDDLLGALDATGPANMGFFMVTVICAAVAFIAFVSH